MRSVRRFFSRLIKPATRRAQEERLKEEITGHIALQTEENLRAGLSPVEARRRAMLKFGGVEAMKQDYRATGGLMLIENFVQDVRFAWRMLRKSPGFAVVAVATLAFAIGANSVVFGVLNALILRPLNVPHARSLWGIERGSDKAINHSYPDYRDLRDRSRSFEDLAAYNVTSVTVDTGNNPAGAWILETTGNYFDVLGIQPYLGRFFHASDEHGPNSAPYIVLTYVFWQNHFQSDRGVVGRVVQLDKHPFTILGVAPAEFRGTLLIVNPDFWVPFVNQEQVEGENVLEVRGHRGLLMVMGHLKAGVTPAQAVADLNSVGTYLEKTYPKDDAQMTFSLTRPGLAGDWLGAPLRAFLAGLMLLAGLILLAACANLGTLFAARAADRSREFAVRLALGSGPLRILRQLLTEGVLISLIGGGVGLWGSVELLRAMSVWEPLPSAPLQIPVYADANVYIVALVLSLVSGFLFSAVPVRQVLRTDPYQVIKSGSTAAAGGRISVRDLLLVVQVAICAVLVTSSLVAVRGLVRSLHSNFGFVPQGALLVDTGLNTAGYAGEALPAMQKRIIHALEAIPGVQSVGWVDRLPLYYGSNGTIVFTDQTGDLKPANAAAEPAVYQISPEYFTAAQTTLFAGRPFSWHDDEKSPRVAVVNREFATKIFGAPNQAVGKYFKRADGTRIQVVGIVEDGKYGSLAEDLQPAIFLPVLQWPSAGGATIVVRSNREPQQLGLAIKDTMHGLDPGLFFLLSTWTHELESALFPSRMATRSLGVLGALGAMLSITGIFGMAAYSVSKRLKELGIRIALGAQSKEVLRAALGRALRLLAAGSLTGLLLGILASRVLAAIVYQATPRDPVVLGGVVLAMALLGLVATWIPARRALSIDPMKLLREE
ncbi:MAG TPA: ABC transporter permease [Candidatus Acidoferrum sp.]|nr:ABC transporter permease [Candidatus Acidoferrum sp.]